MPNASYTIRKLRTTLGRRLVREFGRLISPDLTIGAAKEVGLNVPCQDYEDFRAPPDANEMKCRPAQSLHGGLLCYLTLYGVEQRPSVSNRRTKSSN